MNNSTTCGAKPYDSDSNEILADDQAERNALSIAMAAALQDNHGPADELAGLQRDTFYNPSHHKIHHANRRIWARGGIPDLQGILDDLIDNSDIGRDPDLAAYLHEIGNTAADLASFPHWVLRVVAKAHNRRQINELHGWPERVRLQIKEREGW